MESPFPPFDPDGEDRQPEDHNSQQVRLRDISLRSIFPNFLTLLAICSGLTAIRFAIEGRVELSVAAITFAGFLDGIDGRVARFLKSTSRFGAEMDSLADFVNFGVAPALLIYFTLLTEFGSIGWIVVLLYASCACLRLARFNVMIDSPDRPEWHNSYFVGVPAPAGALIVLLPIYIILLGIPKEVPIAAFTEFYTAACAILMVSNLPTFSGKNISQHLRRDLVLPFLICAVLLTAAVISYPWWVLSTLAIMYLLSLPISYRAYKVQQKADEAEPTNPQQG